MRQTLVKALSHANERIRILAANLVATIVRRSSISRWPALLPGLVKQLSESKAPPPVLGASGCLKLIVDDVTPQVVQFPGFESKLLPVVLQYLSHPSEYVRSDMLQCVQHFSKIRIPLESHLPAVMAKIMPLAKDASFRVRRQVCRAVRQIVDTMILSIYPQMDKIVEYFVQACSDADDSVASEALEVWPSLCNKIRYELSSDPVAGAIGSGTDKGVQLLRLIVGKFPKLVPVMLRRMSLTDDIVAERNIPADDDAPDCAVPDSDQQIRSAHRRSHYGTAKLAPSAKKAAGEPVAEAPEFGGADVAPAQEIHHSLAEVEDSGRATDAAASGSGQYFRGRDAAIEALGWLSEVAEGDVIRASMPQVMELTKMGGSANSWKREAAYTCVCAIAERNPNAFDPYIHLLEPLFLNGMKDPSPCVRAAACTAAAEMMQVLGAHRDCLSKLTQQAVLLSGDKYKYV